MLTKGGRQISMGTSGTAAAGASDSPGDSQKLGGFDTPYDLLRKGGSQYQAVRVGAIRVLLRHRRPTEIDW